MIEREELRKLFLLVVSAYERTYLDAVVLLGLLQNREVPNLEDKLDFFRHDPKVATFVHSQFEPLYDLLESGVDEEELRKALLNIPPPRKPN
jgi:hypothetical protein